MPIPASTLILTALAVLCWAVLIPAAVVALGFRHRNVQQVKGFLRLNEHQKNVILGKNRYAHWMEAAYTYTVDAKTDRVRASGPGFRITFPKPSPSSAKGSTRNMRIFAASPACGRSSALALPAALLSCSRLPLLSCGGLAKIELSRAPLPAFCVIVSCERRMQACLRIAHRKTARRNDSVERFFCYHTYLSIAPELIRSSCFCIRMLSLL